MKILWVARKYIREILREPQFLLLTILVPAAMMLVMAFGYGQNPRLVTYNVLLADRAQGLAREDIFALENAKYTDGRPIFNVFSVDDLNTADEKLRNKEAAMLVIFTRDTAGALAREVKGDGTSLAFINSSSYLEVVLNPVQEKRERLHPIVDMRVENLSINMPQTDFDAFAPGVMIMAILLIIPQTATLIGRELRTGTATLLQLSPLSTTEWFAGISLAQMGTAVVQVVLMLLMAVFLGFQTQGSFALAFVICLILSFSSIGLGLLTACIIHNDSEGVNTGSMFSMLQVFLSGAFFPFTIPAWLTINGHQLGLFDMIPATQAMMILRQSLVSGAGLVDVSFRMGLMIGLSVLYFMLGIVVFNRRISRP